MATVHVRRLDDDVVRQLKRRAVENNRSLESEVRHILEQAAEDGMTEKIRAFAALAKRLRRETGDLPQTPAHIFIREDRDSGHRPA